MNHLVRCLHVAAVLVVLSCTAAAQLSGIKTIDNTQPTGGNNYASFIDAITALNAAGVGAGGVTFNVVAGQTFIGNPPEITATGTSANPILFQKSGSGANPLIMPSTPGTVASSTTLGSHGDGIVVINGGDYITFDGIDLQTDTTFTGVGMMEYGYYLKKASGDDACKNVTIRNCSITLNKAAIYSFGIFVSNISGTSSVTVTSIGGRSENIKLYNVSTTNSYGGIQLRGYAAASPYDFYDQNIQVGVDGPNTITNYGGAGTTAYGIYAIYQNDLKLANNTVISGPGTTTTLYGIFTSTGTNSNVDIYGNTVTITGGGTTSTIYAINNAMGGSGTTNVVNMYNNTVTGCSYPTATSGVMYLLYTTATSNKVNVYGNVVSNNTAPGTGSMYCLYESGAVVDSVQIYNNTISGNSKTGTGTIYCLYSSPAATANVEIFGNTIRDNTTAGGWIYSLYSGAGSTVNIYRNSIFNQSSTAGTSPIVYGVYITSGTSTRVFNNFVSDLRATVSTSSNAVSGIYISGGTFTGAYYNTVFLNATSTSTTTFGTSGIYASTTPTVDLRNNVVVNLSEPGPTGGGTVAYRRSSSTLTTYAAESNNNDFYVNTAAGVRRYFYGELTGASVANADSTLAAYKARVAPRDANSIGENPPFINASTPPYDLHISTTSPTQLESGGTPVTAPIAITEDYDGNTRNATTPDIGADEFAGLGADLTPPSIVYTPVGNTTAGTVQTLTATIADPSGVPTAGIGRPVLYWKRHTDTAYVGATGTYIGNDQYTFSFGAGTLAGDTVYYFVAAQDSFENVGVFPSIGAGGFSPNPPQASIPPTNPSSYRILPLFAAGTYTVGSTLGQFTSLRAAFDSLNNSIVAGNVTLSVLNEGTTEPDMAQLAEVNYGPGGPFTITIKPAAGANPTIAGSNGRFLIKLIGADNVVIDGSNTPGGTTRNLTLRNDIQSTNQGAIWVGGLGAGQGANNVTIKNCILLAGRNDTTNTFGVYAAQADTVTSSGTGDNDNLVIENNEIQRARFGVYARGIAATGIITGLAIRNNLMGSDSAGFEISYRGVDIGNADSAVVTGNEIFNMVQPMTFTMAAIHLDLNVANAVISKNKIYRMRQTNTGTYGAIGIEIGSSTGSSNVTIANNMISDLTCDGGGTSTASNPYGIRIVGGTNHKVYYNSVSMTGSFLNTTTSDISAAFIVTVSTATGLDVRNNLFSNTMTGGTGTRCYGIYAVSASLVFGTIDHNNYYASGPNGVLGRQGSTDVPDLAGWRAFTGQDSNSVSGDPFFLNPATNLHIDSTQTPLVVSNAGTPIAGITTDIDGQTRSATTPDIGADEFAVFVPPPPAEAIADHLTSTMRVTVSNEGNIGYINAFPPTGQGNGFMFNPVSAAGQRLFEGSLIIALDSVRVSDAARNNQSPEQFDADFRFRANLDSSQSSGNRKVIVTSYDDSLAEQPIGVSVTQRTVSFDTAGLSSILLVELNLTNNSASTYTDLVVGAYFDWDVTSAATDRGAVIVDSTNTIPGINNGNPFPIDMMEMHAGTSPNAWVGVVPLSRNRFLGRRIAIQSSEIYPPHMTNADKWRYVNQNRATNPNGDAGSAVDHGQIFGLGPYTIPASGSRRVGFALVAGASLQEFINNARAAQRAWVQRLGNTMDTIIVVGVNERADLPQTFDLQQNYPNPFNPTTTIRYALPREARVSLQVFSILGQQVAELVKDVQGAGYYDVVWNGRNRDGLQVATGVYFYRLEAHPSDGGAPFVSVKRMILMK